MEGNCSGFIDPPTTTTTEPNNLSRFIWQETDARSGHIKGSRAGQNNYLINLGWRCFPFGLSCGWSQRSNNCRKLDRLFVLFIYFLNEAVFSAFFISFSQTLWQHLWGRLHHWGPYRCARAGPVSRETQHPALSVDIWLQIGKRFIEGKRHSSGQEGLNVLRHEDVSLQRHPDNVGTVKQANKLAKKTKQNRVFVALQNAEFLNG